MKKHFFLLLLLCGFTSVAMAQSLQFSRVLLVTNSDQTVPSNAVWKVESYTPSIAYNVYTSYNSGTPGMHQIMVNGVSHIVGHNAGVNNYYNSGAHGASMKTLPMWLPDGTTLRTGTNVSQISVIEFIVVP